MSNELAIASAEDAERLRHNPVWKNILSSINRQLQERELECPTTNKELAADIIRCKQLMFSIEREIYRVIEDGEAAKAAQIKELKKKPMERVFKR